MLQPSTVTPKDLGDGLGSVIPGRDPELAVTIKRIPVSELDLSGKIIPVCEPTLAGKEKEYLLDCLESNWISSAGKYIPAFEEKFAAECHCKYGVACANGTVALHLGLAALGLEPGDEVILPTFTMIATINAVTYTGATPVLIDSEPCTWNMDVEQLAGKITPKTKAIIPVHTYGHPVDMDPIMELAEQHGLFVLEDAAEAHGAEYKGRRAGGLGHAGGFSFYANKIITTGEGGMITTNNAKFAALAHNLRDHAFSSERHFWHKFVGFNYRMTNMQAAIGLAQTEQMAGFVENRRRNAALYTEYLQEIPGIVTPPEANWAKNVFWMYSILVEDEFGLTRDQLRAYLARYGIETRTFFIPMHLQPIYYKTFKGQRFPVAEMLCQRGFYLPSASSLTAQQIKYITGIVRQAYEEAHS
ncbi:MAG: GDP-perosamine synthase [Chloroflexota bacterium]|nr:MAG: GDP-perosamine synthase [Chloroflexota bacterium]